MTDGMEPTRRSKSDQSPLEIAARFMDSAPVDLDGIADALGIDVFVNKEMDDSLSGLITSCDECNSGFRIEINGKHSIYRQRFTLAHELAHYLLHRDVVGNGITDSTMYRSDLSTHYEVEANNMAGKILMPSNLVRKLYQAGLRSISGLQAAFLVSDEAMRIRLKQLRLAS